MIQVQVLTVKCCCEVAYLYVHVHNMHDAHVLFWIDVLVIIAGVILSVYVQVLVIYGVLSDISSSNFLTSFFQVM